MELWTYYKVTIGGRGGAILLRLTGESGGRLFGLEVDDHGKSLRRSDGTLRFRILDRNTLKEMIPLTLFGGRLVAAEKVRPAAKPTDGTAKEGPAPPP